MSVAKKCKVIIFGETFSLVSDEAEEQVAAAAQSVDAIMRSIAERSGIADSRRIAVLAALQLASELKRSNKVLEAYEKKELQLVERLERELFSL